MKTLLILDDDEQLLKDIKEVTSNIEDIGKEITIFLASNYASAVDLFSKCKIDMYLLDIDLKDKDKSKNGVSFAEMVREDDLIAPITFQTIKGDDRTRIDIHKTTLYYDFLPKPWGNRDLTDTLKRMYKYSLVTGTTYLEIPRSGIVKSYSLKEVVYIKKVKYNNLLIIYLYHPQEGVLYEEEIRECSLQKIMEMPVIKKKLIRCHNSYIINPDFIDEKTHDCIKLKYIGEEIKIGRAYKNNLWKENKI